MSILDVAKAAGVSTATVSRVLNNFPHVREETVNRVREAVQALNYTPLRARRDGGDPETRGRPGRTGNVAVITLGQARDWLQMPVMASAVAGIRTAVSERGFRLILEEILDPTKPNPLIDRREIDGAIVFVTGALPSDVCNEALAKLSEKVPIVWAMGDEHGNYDVDHVTYDNLRIGNMACEYLRSRNCREIGLVSLNPAWIFMRLRAQSFLNSAYDAGRPATAYVVSEDQMLIDSYGKRVVAAKSAEEIVAAIAAAQPKLNGLFTLNDQTTAMLAPILTRHGIRPERDVTIVSCDNEQSRLAALQPRPATIDIGAEEVGYRAMTRLVNRMRHPEESPLIIRVAARLVVAEKAPVPA
jgi:LacI family transcriptional regulator